MHRFDRHDQKAAAGQDEASRRYTWLDDGFTCAVDFGEEINIAVTVSVRLGEKPAALFR